MQDFVATPVKMCYFWCILSCIYENMSLPFLRGILREELKNYHWNFMFLMLLLQISILHFEIPPEARRGWGTLSTVEPLKTHLKFGFLIAVVFNLV